MNRSVSSILVIVLWFYPKNSVHANTSALCFLTKRADMETFEFAEELAKHMIQYDLHVYIAIDKNNFNSSLMNKFSNIQILNITREHCISYGYRKTTRLGRDRDRVTAWDKALLYFSVLNKTYSFVWLIEDDVFIPSVKAFRSIHQLYSKTNDLVIRDSQLNLFGNTSYWFWHMAAGNFIPPWSRSMVNVVGLSRRMLQEIANEIQWRGTSLFHEYFFLTLALQSNMTIVLPSEINTLRHIEQYSWNNISERPNNLWHPVKNPTQRNLWRQRLAKEMSNNQYTINLNDLNIVCEDDHNMETIVKHLSRWLIHFEISKVDLLPKDRYRIREYFLNLIEKCQHKINSTEVVLMIKKLAENAYQLPERTLNPLVANKSLYYLYVEKALQKNKDDIIRSLSNGSDKLLLERLRSLSRSLIYKLTSEIQRQLKCQGKQSTVVLSKYSLESPNPSTKRYRVENLTSFPRVILIMGAIMEIFWLKIVIKQKFFRYILILLTFSFTVFFWNLS